MAFFSPTILVRREMISGEGFSMSSFTRLMGPQECPVRGRGQDQPPRIASALRRWTMIGSLPRTCCARKPIVDCFPQAVERHRHCGDARDAGGVERPEIGEQVRGGLHQIAGGRK